MMRRIFKVLVLVLAGWRVMAASGLDGAVRIQDGNDARTNKSSRVTITGQTNLFAGTLTATSTVTAASVVAPSGAYNNLTITNTAPRTITISGGAAATDASLFPSWYAGVFRISAGASFTLSNPSNPTDGQVLIWEISQTADSVVMTFPVGTNFHSGTGVGTFTLSGTSGARDKLKARYNSAADQWDIEGIATGF